jgi:5-methyltetrahydrofolate--homocysteine methyltransferase
MTRTDTNSLTLLERLARGDQLVSDGATGTYLQSHGLEAGGCPEEFNASHPEVVRGMAKAYFDAGSDMALTNSFGGTRPRLKHYGYENRVRELNKLAAEHVKSQAPPGHFVVGSVGPTGLILEPMGETSPEELYDILVEQITALEEGGADAVDIETMIFLGEAKLAIKAAREHTNLTVISTMTFSKEPRGLFTMDGTTPERMVNELRDAGADIVGANCGEGVDVMVEVARQLREAGDGYLLIHSNAGIPDINLKSSEITYKESPEYMAERFKAMADIGINIIGGCCGTGPDHIRALAKAVRG